MPIRVISKVYNCIYWYSPCGNDYHCMIEVLLNADRLQTGMISEYLRRGTDYSIFDKISREAVRDRPSAYIAPKVSFSNDYFRNFVRAFFFSLVLECCFV